MSGRVRAGVQPVRAAARRGARTELLALAEESGVPVRDVLVSDASRRTTALNAYVSGFGATRRIVVYDTLLDGLPDGQIESIVAHELGHVVNRDVLTGTLIGALGAAAGTALLGWLLSWTPLLRRAGADGPGDPRVVPAGPLPARRGEPARPPRCRTRCPGRSRPAPTCTPST